MFQKLRVALIKRIIDINENIFFERRLRKVYKTIFNKQLRSVIDVGANKGQSISFFLNIDPLCKIYAFEPNNSLFRKLEEKYANLSNIKLYKLGVSDHAGEKTFQENVLDYTSTFEEINLNSKYLQHKSAIMGVKPELLIKDKYNVEVVTLSGFINKEVNEIIDVVKIDIEGHEYAALQGLFGTSIRHSIRYIQIEDHADDMYLNKASYEKIEKLLADNAFIQFATISHGFGKINDIIFKNTSL